jgi:membrane protease YdiL (CAAX protease family)
MTHRKQLTVLVILLVVFAICTFASYAFFLDLLVASNPTPAPMPDMGVSNAVLGLINAGIFLVLYGVFGLAGYGLARRVGLPGIYSPDGSPRRWVVIPLLVGLAAGVIMLLVDLLLAPVNGYGRLAHPPFPVSILSSITAGIGEEILFRGLVFGLWALLLTWLFKRFNGRAAALWIANLLAALAFAAGHLPTAMFLTGAATPAEINPVLIGELFLLNGVIGLAAGQRYMKDGLVAAAGVHFWADVVWHVLYGLTS